MADLFNYYSHKKINRSRQIELARKELVDTLAIRCSKFIGLQTDRDGKIAIVEISPTNIEFLREGQIIRG
jgi:hypothetical protein